MPSKEVAESLKTISIRGRMALAATCFEHACKALGVWDEVILNLIEYLWAFVSSTEIETWEFNFPGDARYVIHLVTNGLDNVCVGDYARLVNRDSDNIRVANYAIDEAPLTKVNPAYLQLPLILLYMIHTIYEDIGGGNLYSGTGEYSEPTHTGISRVLTCMEVIGLSIPDLAPFQKSSFLEEHGWGNPAPRSFFEAGQGTGE